MVSVQVTGQIEPATDGPKPLNPIESVDSFQLPSGFRMELVASEPLIEEPSGVCWDAEGHLYVSELHGYNLEGQFDIETLNKTGKLDRVVRRIQANEQAKKDAEAETYGVIKRLADDDGDGRMDRAVIFAQGLPPCFGMVAARDGIIVVCAPDIYYLADLDNDGVADVRERLFTGFQEGVLERRINAPQWGLDNWIYVGGGGRADAINGPYLDGPVTLGRTDFRFKADGSAIEPVAGSTGTFGHTFTAEGDRLTIGTGTPGYQVIPLPWRYLKRNPELSIPSVERNAAQYQSTFPIAKPHPWRERRASDPGFSKYYTDHYGKSESTPSGYFTSACSPFIYRDVAFPKEYWGHNFSCEPAQNLIHHSVPTWDGSILNLLKGGEEGKEFLSSTDQWFHPMNLSHGPEGAIYITDFYREIIEDYSAIPRYLQQQYGLVNGKQHGRVWRLTHEEAPDAPIARMSHLFNTQLAEEIGSPHAWRRETARRLLIERKAQGINDQILAHLRDRKGSPASAINALYALRGLGALTREAFEMAFLHEDWSVVKHALIIGDPLPKDTEESQVVAEWLSEIIHYRNEPRLLLQIALSLGEFQTSGALDALAYMADQHGDIHWIDTALVSSVYQREEGLLSRVLLRGGSDTSLAETLVATLASRGEKLQIQKAKTAVKFLAKAPQKELFNRILDSGLSNSEQVLERLSLDAPEPPDQANLKRIEEQLPRYLEALNKAPDLIRGRNLFNEHCATCHEARGLGLMAGPNLDSEWQRASEIIVRDILFPNESITEGFGTIRLEMRRGSDVMGLMASESPTSVTLRFPGGQEFTFLKKHIHRIHTHKVSMMPAQFVDVLAPNEVASIIGFLRHQEP